MSDERPHLEVMRYVEANKVQPKHLANLKRLEPFLRDGLKAKDLAMDIAMGRSWLWEIEGTDGAIVLTSVQQSGASRWLHLDGIAGDGIIAAGPAITRDLKTIVREYALDECRATTARDGWFPVAEEMGFIPISTNYALRSEDDGK